MKSFLILIILFSGIRVDAQADKTYIRQGNDKFEEGEYQQAEIEYRKALEKEPGSYRADYNLGNALYKQQQYDAAVSKYTSLAKNEKDRQKLNRYFYNLGNAFFEGKKYKESAEAYKNALRNDPGDMNAKHNLQLALKMLNQNNQQKNQNKNNDEQQKDNQNNKSNQQDQQNRQPGDEQQQEQPRQVKDQISPEDAERILQALENEEKKVMQKVQEQKQHARKVPLEKNW